MAQTIVAVFSSRAAAERVADELVNDGIPREDIRLADASTRQDYEQIFADWLGIRRIEDCCEIEVIAALERARFLESSMSTLLHGPAPT